MKQIKAVIFDMDGVLINTEPLHFRMWKETFKNRGLEIDYEHYKGCIGSTHDYLLDLILQYYGKDFHGDQKLRTEAAEIKQRIIDAEGFPEIAGVKEMLECLKKAGYMLAIASSSPVHYIDMAMKYIGVRDYFTVINSGEYVERSKPAPDIYLDTAKKLGVDPIECIVLEDSTNGSKAARNAGMLCVGFHNPDSGEQDLQKTVKVIHGLNEFTPELIQSFSNQIHFHNITRDDMKNGDGIRTVLWVCGCDHGCSECQNPITWDPLGGMPFDEDSEKELFSILKKDYISGVTFSGGDPLYNLNIPYITYLAKKIKSEFPDKTIWVYTGDLWEEVMLEDVMNYIDVLVDGPFVKEEKNVSLHWVGSSNQRVLDVQRSLKEGKAVCIE